MEVICDSRESALFEALKMKNKTKEWITTGDVVIKKDGKIKVIIERKTLSDMMSSIIDNRCNKQLNQMREAHVKTGCVIMFVIEANRIYNANVNVDAINTKLRHFVLQGIPYVRTKSIEDTADYIQKMTNDLEKCDFDVVDSMPTSTSTSSDEEEDDILHKSHQQSDDEKMKALWLSIPGIGDKTAEKLMERFTFGEFLRQGANRSTLVELKLQQKVIDTLMSLFEPGSSQAFMVLSKIKKVGTTSATVILEHFTLPQLAGNITREEISELRMSSKKVGMVVATVITDLLSK